MASYILPRVLSAVHDKLLNPKSNRQRQKRNAVADELTRAADADQ